MSKIRYTIRLYRLHDLDLITFIMTHEFDIMHAIYSSVTAFAKGEAFLISIPPITTSEMPQLRRVYTKTLILDTEKDSSTISMLDRISPGKRNNFFKNLLRLYLMYPFSECFFNSSEDLQYFEEKLKVFRTGQREVRAGKLKKSRYIKKELSSQNKTEGSPHEEIKQVKPDNNQSTIKDAITSSTEVMQEPDQSTSGTNDDEILAIFNDLGGNI